jgi:hypothetical protein
MCKVFALVLFSYYITLRGWSDVLRSITTLTFAVWLGASLHKTPTVLAELVEGGHYLINDIHVQLCDVVRYQY